MVSQQTSLCAGPGKGFVSGLSNPFYTLSYSHLCCPPATYMANAKFLSLTFYSNFKMQLKLFSMIVIKIDQDYNELSMICQHSHVFDSHYALREAEELRRSC